MTRDPRRAKTPGAAWYVHQAAGFPEEAEFDCGGERGKKYADSEGDSVRKPGLCEDTPCEWLGIDEGVEEICRDGDEGLRPLKSGETEPWAYVGGSTVVAVAAEGLIGRAICDWSLPGCESGVVWPSDAHRY